MADNIQLTNPQPNQILTYSEIDNKFINVDADANLLGITFPSLSVNALSPDGVELITRFTDSTLNFKTIRSGSGIDITETSSEITFDVLPVTNALTLGGLEKSDFFQISNNLSESDPVTVRENIDVYSKDESHDQFMETNASNIPDEDDLYELGSNGRRFSDIYAYTFHGTATHAELATEIKQHGALEGDVLTWIGNSWRPRPGIESTLKNSTLGDLGDVTLDGIQDLSLLIYYSEEQTWYPIDLNSLLSQDDEDSDSEYGMLDTITNVGSGTPVFKEIVNDSEARFKTLLGDDYIELSNQSNNSEVHFSFNIEKLSTEKLNDVNTSALSNGDGLVWRNDHYENKPIIPYKGNFESDGQIIRYSEEEQAYINTSVTFGKSRFVDLEDTPSQLGEFNTILGMNDCGEMEWLDPNEALDLSNYVDEADLLDYAKSSELSDYVTFDDLSDTYVTEEQLENYVIHNDLNKYVKIDDMESRGYLTNADFSNYLLIDDAESTYAKKEDISDMATQGDLENYAETTDLDKYLLKDGLQIVPKYGEVLGRPESADFSVSVANVHTYTLTQPDTPINLYAPDDGFMYTVTVFLNGGEENPPTWPGNISWIGGEEPTLTPRDILVFMTFNGVDWIGSYSGFY